MARVDVTRRCRGAGHRISITNRAGERSPQVVVDGEPVEGFVVPYAEAGSVVEVDVEL